MSPRLVVSLFLFLGLAAAPSAMAGYPERHGKYWYYGPHYKAGYDHQSGYCYGKYQYQCGSGQYITCYYFPKNYYDGKRGWYYGDPGAWIYHCSPDHTWFKGDRRLDGPPKEPQSNISFQRPPEPPDLP